MDLRIGQALVETERNGLAGVSEAPRTLATQGPAVLAVIIRTVMRMLDVDGAHEDGLVQQECHWLACRRVRFKKANGTPDERQTAECVGAKCHHSCSGLSRCSPGGS